MKYIVNTTLPNDDVMTLDTNKITNALHYFEKSLEDDNHCQIVDGETGEILLCFDPVDPENWYATEEMALMFTGYHVTEVVEEEDECDCPCSTCIHSGQETIEDVVLCNICDENIFYERMRG